MRKSILLAALILAACGGAPAAATPTPAEPLPAEPPAFPGSVGATAWVDSPVPSELREGHGAFATLEELQREIVAQLAAVSEPSTQVRVGLLAPLGEEEATAYAFVSGIGDDAVAGEEYRYEFRPGRTAGSSPAPRSGPIAGEGS